MVYQPRRILKIYVLNDDKDVSDILIDGTSLDGFSMGTSKYIINEPYTFDVP